MAPSHSWKTSAASMKSSSLSDASRAALASPRDNPPPVWADSSVSDALRRCLAGYFKTWDGRLGTATWRQDRQVVWVSRRLQSTPKSSDNRCAERSSTHREVRTNKRSGLESLAWDNKDLLPADTVPGVWKHKPGKWTSATTLHRSSYQSPDDNTIREG